MRTPRPLAAVALSTLALCALTACGPDEAPKDAAAAPASPSASPSPSAFTDLSAADISAQARAAGGRLHSATMAISIPGYPGGRLEAAFAADTSGACTGHVSIEGKGSADFVRSDDKVWLKPDDAFLASIAPNAPAAVHGKWIAGGESNPQDFSSFCAMDLQIQQHVGQNSDGTPGKGLAKADPRQVDGVRTATVTMTDDQGLLVRYDIAAEGEPRVLSTESGAGNMTVRFSGFDQPVQATPPAADQVV
ncbi:hypothetical protein ACFV6F_23585 [Kitasatospora phosalacinea]|uniref:hypothetical protein n=1 Tax=Kitasatospora phosalacinea TaxID=2065 RepID=UPI0036663B9F